MSAESCAPNRVFKVTVRGGAKCKFYIDASDLTIANWEDKRWKPEHTGVFYTISVGRIIFAMFYSPVDDISSSLTVGAICAKCLFESSEKVVVLLDRLRMHHLGMKNWRFPVYIKTTTKWQLQGLLRPLDDPRDDTDSRRTMRAFKFRWNTQERPGLTSQLGYISQINRRQLWDPLLWDAVPPDANIISPTRFISACHVISFACQLESTFSLSREITLVRVETRALMSPKW